jgi:hypothetical protein
MKELDKGQEHHFILSKVLHAHAGTKELLTEKPEQHGSNARGFNLTQQVINPWKTSPLPTTETWIRGQHHAECRRKKEMGAKLQILAIDKRAQARRIVASHSGHQTQQGRRDTSKTSMHPRMAPERLKEFGGRQTSQTFQLLDHTRRHPPN